MAFSVSIQSPMVKPERISRSLGVFAGKVTISSYATTLVECTALTKYFRPITNTNATAALFPKGIVSVSVDGISESGYAFRWDATTGAFGCYYPVAATTLGAVVAATTAAGIPVYYDSVAKGFTTTASTGNADVVVAEKAGSEANAHDAVGAVNFIAIGLI